MSEKKCPMPEMDHCAKEECAWWVTINEEEGQCAVVNIARELFIMADIKINEIGKKLNQGKRKK